MDQDGQIGDFHILIYNRVMLHPVNEVAVENNGNVKSAIDGGGKRNEGDGMQRKMLGLHRCRASTVPSSREVSEAEHRQRERQIEHQSSLRSLMSASDGEGATEEEILRQILDEGLLEGINLDDLDEAQEEEISERIAEAYRQKHSRRRVPRTTNVSTRTHDTTPVARSSHSRSHSAQPNEATQSSPAIASNDSRHPPVSRSRLFEASDTESPRLGHRRRASDHGRRQTSPSPRTVRTSLEEAVRHQAARSATDLSNRPQSSDNSRQRPRHSSEVRRANIDQPSFSELWRNAGVRETADSSHRAIVNQNTIESPQHLSPTIEQPSTLNHHHHGATESIPATVGSRVTPVSPPGNGVTGADTRQEIRPQPYLEASFLEPSISCDRCSKPSIQYKMYKHCSRCSMNVCIQCYRQKRACNHWFGFGYTAKINFDTSSPVSASMEPPHVMIGRKYLPPPTDAAVRSEINQNTNTTTVYTSSNPTERLQEGKFCDRCYEFANACHWECASCNEGEWGFCNECVNTQHCCTHPLLPIVHKDFALGEEQGAGTGASRRSSIPLHASVLPIPVEAMSRPSSSDDRGRVELEGSSSHPTDLGIGPDYLPLTFTTHCDICSCPIPPSSTRFHCPFHMPSSPDSIKGKGDYDICTGCYTSRAKTGAISAANGINGWRRCPKGHRMVITGFEDRGDGQRRVVVKDLVGGWALKDEYYETSSQPFGTDAGKWSWRDLEGEGERTTASRKSRAAKSTSTTNPTTTTTTTTLPPSGGVGLHCHAMWSYLPDHEADPSSKDELLFPRGAEIREAEDINGDWFWGVYMGDKGVFPGGYCIVIGATGLQ